MGVERRYRLPSCLAVLLLTLPTGASGQVATQLEDINRSFGGEASSFPKDFVTLGRRALFTAADFLWVTDGTPQGTRALVDAPAGQREPFVYQTDDTLFWYSDDSRLWRTDGTPQGTVPLTPPDVVSLFDPVAFLPLGDLFFFVARTPETGLELWRSDGTPGGTALVKDLFPGHVAGWPRELVELDGTLFFLGLVPCESRQQYGLWRSDGTEDGTALVHCNPEASLEELVPLGDQLIFSTGFHDAALWSSDGTATGIRRLRLFPDTLRFLVTHGDRVYFIAGFPSGPNELWRTDGTIAGTRLVAGTDLGLVVLEPPVFSNDTTLFLARSTTTGPQLWVTAGTPETTVPLRDLCGDRCAGLEVYLPYLADGPPYLAAAGRLFFLGEDGARGRELWVTDGTGEGTLPLGDRCPGTCGEILGLTAIGDEVYFIALGEGDRYDLWRTDGTPEGTLPVTDLGGRAVPLGSFSGRAVGKAGRRLVFAAVDPTYGGELWGSDGTPRGTGLLADLARTAPGSAPEGLTELGDDLVFSACDGDFESLWRSAGTPATTHRFYGISLVCTGFHRQKVGELLYFDAGPLFRTDGTTAGTFPVFTPAGGSILTHLAPLGGELFFALRHPARLEVWRSDGTRAGTRLAFTVDGPSLSVGFLVGLEDELYFTLQGPDGMDDVWRSDGTPGGTRRLTQLGRISSFSGPGPRFTRVGDDVYFIVERELWRSDGTAGGTSLVLTIEGDYLTEISQPLAFQGNLYFLVQSAIGQTGFYRLALWRSDGTAAGSAPVKVFAPHSFLSFVASGFLHPSGDVFLFAALDEVHGSELWASDGTPEGTRLVRDLAPGAAGSRPEGFVSAGDEVYFTARTPNRGWELWRTDGTSAGTRLVHDLAPGPPSSFPVDLTVAGSHLYFSADDGITGREPWALPLEGGSACEATATALCLQGGRFRAEMRWRTPGGQTGGGKAVQLTPDTGYFWFFNPANVEAVVKVLDGRGTNGHHWVFYGALSNVEYYLTVTDTDTGVTRRYFNPFSRLASVGDTEAFGPLGASPESYVAYAPPTERAVAQPEVETARVAPRQACEAGATRLCLQEGRFAVEVDWQTADGRRGTANAEPLSGDTGYFWFFQRSNVETVVKVLDGRPANGHFWVFFGALSNVAYQVKVTDTVTGLERTYRNRQGRFASVADTRAF